MTQEPLLVTEGVHKRYGGVHALRGVSISVLPGEIHGLVGENGSGKSTLLKILAGQVLPDAGTVRLLGEDLPFGDPTRSLAAGIATVTQETTLVPDLSVAENILLGRRLVRRWYGMDWPSTYRRAAAIVDRLGLELDPRATVRTLRPDEQQMVEIARAISMDARVLILDEPTSSLTDEEVEGLFGVARTLRDEGISTIFVSHRMQEVLDLTDRVTVLRDGNWIATRRTDEVDDDTLIELMVGKQVEQLEVQTLAHSDADDCRLRIRNVSVPGRVHDVSLDVGHGEIVGLAGLVGAGRSDLLAALFGLSVNWTGRIELDGVEISNRNPIEAMHNGIAYVPADRKQHGLALHMSAVENLMMARTADAARLRRPSRRLETREMQAAVEDFGINGVTSNGVPVAALSGGNQQKVVLAKWLRTDPKVLLLDEPTRGVDVGAKGEIYKLLMRVRDEGLATLVSSSEVPELLLLCDRVVVMFRGRIAATLTRGEATEARIAHYAAGRK